MIEMRWKELSERSGKLTVEATRDSDGCWRVLQYRFLVPYAAGNGNLMWAITPEWSDWKNVPWSGMNDGSGK